MSAFLWFILINEGKRIFYIRKRIMEIILFKSSCLYRFWVSEVQMKTSLASDWINVKKVTQETVLLEKMQLIHIPEGVMYFPYKCIFRKSLGGPNPIIVHQYYAIHSGMKRKLLNSLFQLSVLVR